MKSITITGGTGFVGVNLISYLKNYTIIPLTRVGLNSVSLEIPSNTDVVIHLAGKAHDLKKVSKPEEYYQVNYELTKKLYDAFLKSEAKKFIFISSIKAMADSIDHILTEDVEPNPQTDYGKSKLMAERYIQAQKLPEGKSYYILRPCMIHGPGNKGNLNLLYNFVKKGIPYPLATFENKRSFLSIENLCFVIKLLLESEISSDIYNIADEDALSTNEVVEILANSIDKKLTMWKIPIKLVQLSAKIGDYLQLPFNTERLGKLTQNYVVSTEKIAQALGASMPVSAREGLEVTAKSFVSK